MDALIKGVQDGDELVRESALTHLVGFGLEKAAIDGVREKVEKGQDLVSFKYAPDQTAGS